MKEYVSERKNKVGFVGNLSLSFAGLERAEKGQQAIQGFFGGNNGASTSRAGSAAAPEPLSKKANGKRKASEAPVDLTLDSSDIEESKPRQLQIDAGSSDDDDISVVQPEGPVYKCERCGAVISLHVEEMEDERDGLAEAMQAAQDKHEKWHAAQDALPKQKKVKREASAGPAAPKKVKKKKGQQKLKSFFKKS